MSNWLDNPVFQYEITSDVENYYLTLTDYLGNQAFYYTGNLSVTDIQIPEIMVYPNPVIDKVTLSNIDSFGKINARIYDMNGKLLISKTLSDKKEIDLSHLKSGVYFMHLLNASNEIITTKKLMKK